MKNMIFLLFISVSVTAISQSNKTVDWDTDLNFIKVELPKRHYNFYMSKVNETFLEESIKLPSNKIDYRILNGSEITAVDSLLW